VKKQIPILIFFCLTISATSNAGIGITTIDGQELLLYEHSYALVVGNNNYQNFDRLPGAEQDAKDVAKALERRGFSVELALNLTCEKFDHMFTDFAMNRGQNENSRMLFYYAGHGTTLPMAGNETMGYLVMIDTPKSDKDMAGFVSKSIDMQYMVMKSKLMKARHVLYMFDSCFSGTIMNFRSELKPSKISHRVKNPVRQFITAGSANEEVPDQSFFKQVFLDLIEGRVEEPFKDGYITGEELGYYLKAKVPYYFDYQHPQFGKIKNPHLDKGDFVFLAEKGGVTVLNNPIKTSKTGSLIIDTNDMPQMEISIYNSNGKLVYQGKGNSNVNNLTTGKYTVMTSASSHGKSVYVSAGRQSRVHLLQESLKGRIFVDVNPPDSHIRILHMRPKFQQGMVLPPGRYELEASHQNYYQVKKWVSLNANEDLTVEMELKSKYATTLNKKTLKKSSYHYKTFTNQFGMSFVLIPAGSFLMGSPKNEEDRRYNEKQHHVTLTKDFYMQTTEITQGQWNMVMGNNPSGFINCGDDCPVVMISWDDVQEFVKKLNQRDNKAMYRLPTEAEWEYAARAGTTTRFFWGDHADCSHANYGNFGNGSFTDVCKAINPGQTTAVRTYLPNAWGLYDMHGNVTEWCQDYYVDYIGKSVIDPTGPISGESRVARGGSYSIDAGSCRSANREWLPPNINGNNLGARLAASQIQQGNKKSAW